MPSKNATTVVLTHKAQAVKEDLAPVFGLKNILSAALVLLDKLPCQAQKQLIAEAQGVPGAEYHFMGPEETIFDVLIDPTLPENERQQQRLLLEGLLETLGHRIRRFPGKHTKASSRQRKAPQEPA